MYNVLEFSLYLDCNFVEYELENKCRFFLGIVIILDIDVG